MDPSQPSTSGITSTPKITTLPCVNTKISEHRRLFGYAAKGKGQSKKKGKAVGKRSVPTCVLKFVCLATRDPIKPPTSVRERTALANAGLGDASITFDLDGDSMHLHQRIVETFPKLNTTGYLMMLYHRSAENSSFCNLNPPYLPRKLKEVCGQCKIYVKPLQQDLIDSDHEESIQVSLRVSNLIGLMNFMTVISRIILVYYCKCCSLIGYSTCYCIYSSIDNK